MVPHLREGQREEEGGRLTLGTGSKNRYHRAVSEIMGVLFMPSALAHERENWVGFSLIGAGHLVEPKDGISQTSSLPASLCQVSYWLAAVPVLCCTS